MLTSRQDLEFFLDLVANFLTFARAYDGHSSFNFKSTINIEFVFLYLILSVHNISKGRGGGGGSGNVKSFDIYIPQISTIPKRPRV